MVVTCPLEYLTACSRTLARHVKARNLPAVEHKCLRVQALQSLVQCVYALYALNAPCSGLLHEAA